MSKMPITEKALTENVSYIPPSSTLAHGPGAEPTDAKAAIRRCCAAWQRAQKAYFEESEDRYKDPVRAAEAAGRAYCNAMPVLAGEDGIRDFIACAAHGILIETIPQERGTQLIYAAQVALNLLHLQSKRPVLTLPAPSKTAQREVPPPPP